MDFESTLRIWENNQKTAVPSDRKVTEKSKKHLGDWIEAYPPDCKVIEEKKSNFETAGLSRTRKRIDWKRVKIEDSLDIHGLTSEEALTRISRFIDFMLERNLKVGAIVHGKGLHSQAEPVLKPMVGQFFKEHARVVKFSSADRKRGGSGSTLFLIK